MLKASTNRPGPNRRMANLARSPAPEATLTTPTPANPTGSSAAASVELQAVYDGRYVGHALVECDSTADLDVDDDVSGGLGVEDVLALLGGWVSAPVHSSAHVITDERHHRWDGSVLTWFGP